MEEGLERTRAEIAALVARAQSRMPDVRFSIEDRLIFEPTRTPEDAPGRSARSPTRSGR